PDPDVFPQLTGQAFPLPLKNDLITAKSTVDLNAKQFLQIRFGYQKVTEKYGASPVVAPDALGDLTNKYSSLLGGHNWQIGSDKLNEFLVQWSKFDNTIIPDSNLPTFYFASGGVEGQNPNTPQDTHQKKRQIKDDLSWTSSLFGSHYDFNQSNNPIWQVLTTQTKYNEGYLQDFRGSSGLKNDTNNWSPRLGFSYDLHSDAKNIVRAGIGRYYQMPYTNATILFPASAIQSTYGVSYDLGGTNNGPVLNDNGTVFHFRQPLPKAGFIT